MTGGVRKREQKYLAQERFLLSEHDVEMGSKEDIEGEKALPGLS